MPKDIHQRDTAQQRLQRGAGWLWRSSRSGAYHQRFYQYIRKLGFHLYSSCHVLLRIFHYHWMGTLRSQMCGVPF